MSLKITLLDSKGKQKESKESFGFLEDFDIKYVLISEVIRCELLSLRSGNAHTKVRSEVRGGGRKPWKQKGTGRARHGSIRSPLWKGGGVTFGPRNHRNWDRKINKSAKHSALKSIIKDRLLDEAVFELPAKFNMDKTKKAVELVENLAKETFTKAKNNLVVYTTEEKEALRGFLSSGVKMINVKQLKISKLSNADNLVFTPVAREILEERLSKPVGKKKVEKVVA